MYASRENLRLTHLSKLRPAGAEGGKLNAIILAEIRLAKV